MFCNGFTNMFASPASEQHMYLAVRFGPLSHIIHKAFHGMLTLGDDY